MLIFLIVISKCAYRELYPFHISLDCVFVYSSMPKVVGRGVLISVTFLIIFCTQIAPLYEKSSVFRKFFQKISTSKNRPCYIPNSFLTRCTVLTLTPQIAAVSRIDLPCFNERMTFPYSSCFRSLLLTEPTLRPNLPPSATYLALPLLRR